MKIDTDVLKQLCRQRRIPLKEMLRKAGVSPTAYYALARKDSVLPKSLTIISAFLNVPPSHFLTEGPAPATDLLRSLDTVMAKNKKMDREDVLHTLILLKEKPIDRLRRALIRARTFNFHR